MLQKKVCPLFFGGDINLSLSESDLLRRLPQLDWTSLAGMVQLTEEPACYKGKGSTIDFVFANPLALMACKAFSFAVDKALLIMYRCAVNLTKVLLNNLCCAIISTVGLSSNQL